MKYLMLVCSDGETTPEQSETMSTAIFPWIEEMDGRGVRLLGRALDDPETAATVRVRDGQTLVTDGPFADTKEQVAGFDLIDCENLDEAIEVAAKHPVSWFHTIEIRPFSEGLELGAKAREFARGEDGPGRSYLLTMCLDGIAEAPEVEAQIRRDGEHWRAEMEQRGVQVFGHSLQHPDTATTVRVRDGETLVTDGPFVELKEFIGGIDVINCSSREEAIELAAKHPLARLHMVEVRAFWEE
ncbi:MAG TPA: YciI family protein [Solirubrobacteraceae bacterium]|nr:YciI family protein [Solirubrobacteraceae bacterium]